MQHYAKQNPSQSRPSSTLCDCSTSSANVLSQKCITGNTEMVAGEYTCIYSIDLYVQHGFYVYNLLQERIMRYKRKG